MEAENLRSFENWRKAKPEPRQHPFNGAYEPEIRVRLYVVYIIQELNLLINCVTVNFYNKF